MAKKVPANILVGHVAASQHLLGIGYLMCPGALNNLKTKGTGPVCERKGKFVHYRIKDLDRWAKSRWGKPDGRRRYAS